MRSKRESGEVVVEASIVVTLVMIVITVMMYVGMILYQQTLVSVMANQTAANIAQVYGNNLKDPFTGYVDPDRVYQSVTYSNMKTDAYITVVEQKANIFAQYRLKSSRILTTGSTSVEVEIIPKSNELLKSQIVVTIRDHYDVPLVGLFGTSGLVEFAASGRADCVDILEYINGVDAIAGGGIPDPMLQKSCTVTFVPDSDHPGDIQVMTVLRGHTIMSSSRYTNCVMPADPQKGDLEFAGWYTADGNVFTGTTQIEENITVYGKWLCEITMKANEGTVNGKEEDTKKVPYGDRTALPDPVRIGFEFEGWVDSEGNLFEPNDTVIVKNITYTAKWRCLHVRSNGDSKIVMVERKQYQCREINGERKSYELYRCSECAYEYKVTIENKHYIASDYLIETDELIVQGNKDDFRAQCNVNHLSSSVTGVSGSFDKGFGTATVRHMYHITCQYCGMHLPKVWWDNVTGKHIFQEIYWVSWKDRQETICRTPDYKGN